MPQKTITICHKIVLNLWRKFKPLYWKLFGYPDFPPSDFQILAKVNKYTDKVYIPRYQVMSFLWQDGHSVEDIAKCYNVTRERVRQCLWKSYRDSEGV